MDAGGHYSHWLCWLLVDQVEVLDEFEDTEAFDDSAENDSLSVHECQGCAQSHVELAFV